MINLLPYQELPYKKLLEAQQDLGCSFDGSDMGTGKTYMACKMIADLNIYTFIVCSKSGIGVWEKVSKLAGIQDKILDIISYDALRSGKKDYIQKKRRKYKTKIITSFSFHNDCNGTLFVFDEVHRCKSWTSQTGKLLDAAKKTGAGIHMASATAIETPMDMSHIGYALNLFKKDEFITWGIAQGITKNHFQQWDWIPKRIGRTEDEVLRGIRNQIYINKGIRIRKEKIDGFPETQILTELIDAKGAKKLNDELLAKVKELDLKAFDAENDLAALNYERQRLELLLIPAIIEMVKDGNDQGMSVCVFVNFTDTLKELAETLKCDAIWGGQPQKTRQDILDRFQSNEINRIVLNLAAGSESLELHDVMGKCPRLSLIVPNFNSRQVRQALGRVQRTGGKSKSVQKILCLKNTYQEHVYESVTKKLGRIDMVNDGDLTGGIL